MPDNQNMDDKEIQLRAGKLGTEVENGSEADLQNSAERPGMVVRRAPLSTTAVAEMLGVSVASIANWIDAGKLKAGRTPGGHRRVRAEDLVYFLRRQGLPIPEALVSSAPKILVVDDEEPVARWMAEEIKLERPDFEVRTACDGFAAGDLVASWSPDVVILDLRMPGMDGYEVCRRIKAKPETSGTQVIAVTAFYSPQVVRDIAGCGAAACLMKPIDIAVLLTRVEDALHGGSTEQTHAQAKNTESPLCVLA